MRGLVRAYNGFSYGGLAPGHHQGLPSGNLTFIVSLEEPINIVAMPGPQPPRRFDAFVGGLHLRPASVAHPGRGAGISVELSPLASRALFGAPASALASQVVDLADLLGPKAAELRERLSEAGSWAERFAVVDRVLASILRDTPPAAGEMVRAWTSLRDSGGRLPISAVAEEVGYSRRHLGERFSAEFGVAPKAAARVLRFERTCGLLDRGLSLAQAAAAGGYYDQAHLTNEWRELAGQSPAAWQTDELRDRSSPEDAQPATAA